MPPKASSHRLSKSDDGQFGKMWAYLCSHHSVEPCFEEGFFNTLRSNLTVGDTIRCIEVRGDPFSVKAHVVEFCDAMVVRRAEKAVVVAPIGNSVRFSEGSSQSADDGNYISGGRVEWVLSRREHVVTVDGAEVFATTNKGLAHAVAKGERPIPVQEAA